MALLVVPADLFTLLPYYTNPGGRSHAKSPLVPATWATFYQDAVAKRFDILLPSPYVNAIICRNDPAGRVPIA